MTSVKRNVHIWLIVRVKLDKRLSSPSRLAFTSCSWGAVCLCVTSENYIITFLLPKILKSSSVEIILNKIFKNQGNVFLSELILCRNPSITLTSEPTRCQQAELREVILQLDLSVLVRPVSAHIITSNMPAGRNHCILTLTSVGGAHYS